MHAEWVEIGYDDRVEPDDLISRRGGGDAWYSIRWCADHLVGHTYRQVLKEINAYIIRARLAAGDDQ